MGGNLTFSGKGIKIWLVEFTGGGETIPGGGNKQIFDRWEEQVPIPLALANNYALSVAEGNVADLPINCLIFTLYSEYLLC